MGKELHQTDAKEQSKQARVGRTKKDAGNSNVETDKLERTIWTKRKHRMTIFCYNLLFFAASFFVRLFPACVRLSLVWIAPLRLSGEVVFTTFEFWIVFKLFDLGIA